MSKMGLANIDVFRSRPLKIDRPQGEVDRIFEAYWSAIDQVVEQCHGEVWSRSGDGAICIFSNTTWAVRASIGLQEALVDVNEEHGDLLHDSPLFARIGVHVTDSNLQKVPVDQRDNHPSLDLDIAGHLQKDCPIGKVTISKEVYERLGVRKPLFRPAHSENAARAHHVLIERNIMPQEEGLLRGLTDRQKNAMPPVLSLSWETLKPDEKLDLGALNKILAEPLLVILGETTAEDRGPLDSAATSDAVGIIELMAALDGHRQVRVGIDEWDDTADVAADRNVVLIGSGIVNVYAFALNDIFYPAHFVKTDGRVSNQIVVTWNEGDKHFGPHASGSKDSGLVIVSKSPFNLDRHMIWISGITGMGTQAIFSLVKYLGVVDDTRWWNPHSSRRRGGASGYRTGHF